jgi:hypothetical protein
MVIKVFEAATSSVVGDGASTYFWLDNWLPDGRLKDIAPHLFALIPRRLSRSRLVKDCLDGGWLDNTPTDLDALAIDELLAVIDRADVFRCRCPGCLSVELGRKGYLFSKVLLSLHVPWECGYGRCLQVWKSCAPAKCRFFIWLVADRVERC